jgi:hypothetical protein
VVLAAAPGLKICSKKDENCCPKLAKKSPCCGVVEEPPRTRLRKLFVSAAATSQG